MRPSGASSAGRTSSSDRPADCSPTRARTISRATLPDSGCCCVISSRSVRTRVCIRISTTTCVRRSGRRPSSSSTACCAKTAVFSTCSGRTTPSSTSAWPSTTGFPMSTAAAFGACRSEKTASVADCCGTAASWPSPPTPHGPRRSFAESGCSTTSTAPRRRRHPRMCRCSKTIR